MNAQKDKLSMNIPVSLLAHQEARKFAKLQPNSAQAIDIYTHILAMFAATTYLQYLHIDTDREQSAGWNIATLSLGNSASLYLPKFGNLEVRLIGTEEKAIELPPVVDDRSIGLLVFQHAETDLDKVVEVKLIGFTIDLTSPELAIDKLQPIDSFLDRLEQIQLEQAIAPAFIYAPDRSLAELIIELEQIYQNSDDLYFEYNIGKFLKAAQNRQLARVKSQVETEMQQIQNASQFAPLIREELVNHSERDLQAVAAEMAERLQDLWGKLE
jgi:Protein of unknown function (DUF1822)